MSLLVPRTDCHRNLGAEQHDTRLLQLNLSRRKNEFQITYFARSKNSLLEFHVVAPWTSGMVCSCKAFCLNAPKTWSPNSKNCVCLNQNCLHTKRVVEQEFCMSEKMICASLMLLHVKHPMCLAVAKHYAWMPPKHGGQTSKIAPAWTKIVFTRKCNKKYGDILKVRKNDLRKFQVAAR